MKELCNIAAVGAVGGLFVWLSIVWTGCLGHPTVRPPAPGWQPRRSVIDMWSTRRPRFNFDESRVPEYQLPDPLSLEAEHGRPITTAQVWMTRRRPVLLQLFRENVYGVRPTTEYKVEYKEVARRQDVFGIGATARQIRATVRARERSILTRVWKVFCFNHSRSAGLPTGGPRGRSAFVFGVLGIAFLALGIGCTLGTGTLPAGAPDYPAATPGPARVSTSPAQMRLSNRVIEAAWRIESGAVRDVALKNLLTGQSLVLGAGHMPRVVLSGGRIVDLARMEPEDGFQVRTVEADPHAPREEARYAGRALMAEYRDAEAGLNVKWTAELRDDSSYVVQSLALTGDRAVPIAEVIFIDSTIVDARQIGEVDGSVVVCGESFLAVEHPLARNTVGRDSHVRCALPRGNVLGAGQTWRYTSVFGVVEPGQLRRGFLVYLERRRAHPYRPFLHYNNWYDVTLARPKERVTEPECLKAIEFFGRELVHSRGVKLDAFVWDDGWDDFSSLWGFHKGFPDGFRKLRDAAARYGAAQGVWMSPWGGYSRAKNMRIAFGKSRGYETNTSGFSMAGARYGRAFRDVCLNMMREQGVVFFKLDGMGGGNKTTGARAEMADDVDAVLELTRTLRRENPAVFISATVGTWASPFWTFYADSIWRQGGDTGFFGKGDTRQQWITYRDMFCHDRIVQLGPLYPLNSLMLHGPCISDRRNPSRMVRNEKSVADEIWSFFGSGTNLQELYITPRVLTSTMWDELAAAAKWSRANSDVLVDTHWIGGSPGKAEVYGWASWQPRGGIVVLRNPSDKPGSYELELARDLELPDQHLTDYRLKSPRPDQRIGSLRVASVEPLRIELQPFEVLVFEATAVAGAERYDAEAYRHLKPLSSSIGGIDDLLTGSQPPARNAGDSSSRGRATAARQICFVRGRAHEAREQLLTR